MEYNQPKAVDNIQHLVGTRFVASADAYMQEMTGAQNVRERRPTREARYSMVEYDLKDGIITAVVVYP